MATRTRGRAARISRHAQTTTLKRQRAAAANLILFARRARRRRLIFASSGSSTAAASTFAGLRGRQAPRQLQTATRRCEWKRKSVGVPLARASNDAATAIVACTCRVVAPKGGLCRAQQRRLILPPPQIERRARIVCAHNSPLLAARAARALSTTRKTPQPHARHRMCQAEAVRTHPQFLFGCTRPRFFITIRVRQSNAQLAKK